MSKLIPNINRGNKVPYTNADIRDVTTPEGVSALNDELRRISTAVKEVANNSNSPLANTSTPLVTSEAATTGTSSTSSTGSENITPPKETWALTVRDTNSFAGLPKKIQSLNLITTKEETAGLTKRNVQFNITKGSLPNTLKTIPDAEEVNIEAFVEVDESGGVITGNGDLRCLQSAVAGLKLKGCECCYKVGRLDGWYGLSLNAAIGGYFTLANVPYPILFTQKILHTDGIRPKNTKFFKAPKNGTYQVSIFVKLVTSIAHTTGFDFTDPDYFFLYEKGQVARLFLQRNGSLYDYELDTCVPQTIDIPDFDHTNLNSQFIVLQGTTLIPLKKGETLTANIMFSVARGAWTTGDNPQKGYAWVDVMRVSKEQDTEINTFSLPIKDGYN